jgi:hypothetical protein
MGELFEAVFSTRSVSRLYIYIRQGPISISQSVPVEGQDLQAVSQLRAAKAIAEAEDSSGKPRGRVTSAVGSRYKATASEDRD